MNNNTIFSTELEEKYNLYDKIISATYANVFSLSKNKDIILNEFDYECATCRTFLEVATAVAYMTNKKIYLKTNIFDFIRARIKKKNKHIKWIPNFKKINDGIDPHQVAEFEADAFEQDVTIFQEIYKTYYEGKS